MSTNEVVEANGKPKSNGYTGSTFSATNTTSTNTMSTSRPIVPGPLPMDMDQKSREYKESFVCRRKSSHQLSPLRMKPAPQGVDAIDGAESRMEVEEEGVLLFDCFLEGELERNGIQETDIIESAVTSATIESKREEPAVVVPAFHFDPQRMASGGDAPGGKDGDVTPSLLLYKNPKWAKSGRDLKRLADVFAKSPEREAVRQKAKEVVGKEATAAMVWDMMSELFFQGHVTQERIVVLFFFCSDLAILSLQHNTVDYFHRFLVWALQFIRQKVCKWVADNGGWNAVLYASAGNIVTASKVFFVGIALYGVFKALKYAHTSFVHR